MNDVQQFIEDFGLFFEQLGLTRMAGRILAWLMICEPPHQDLYQLTEALQASTSSMSTTTRILIQFGLIERISLPGQRRDHYRLRQEVWAESMLQGMNKFSGFRRLAERGLELLAGAPPERKRYLREMHDLYAFMEREFPALIQRWQQERTAN